MFKIVNILLVLGVWAFADAEKYTLSRSVVVFGEANGLSVSLLQLLAVRNFEVVFVLNGEHHYDTEELISKYSSKVIQCSFEADLQKCADLVAYAVEVKPLDVIIDLLSDSPAEINAVYGLFEATKKPRIYALLSSHSIYTPCREANDVREFGEFHCPPIGDKIVEIPSDMHQSEYDAGLRMLETERELHKMLESRSVSYLALRIAPLFGARESLESFDGEKESPLLTWLLLSGVSSHFNQSILVPKAYRNFKWSTLYTEDLVKVAGAIELLGTLPAEQPFSRTYNLASAQVTLRKLTSALAAALGLNQRPPFTYVEEEELSAGAKHLFYPHLLPPTRAKVIDSGFAQHEIRFAPTELQQALQQTVDFYRQALVNFDANATPSQADEPIRVAVNTLVKSGVATQEQIDAFLDWLRNQEPGDIAGKTFDSVESTSGEKAARHSEL